MVGENFGTTTAHVCDVSRATADKVPQQSRLNFCSKQKQSPGAPLTNFNDGGRGGGSDRGSYFIPKKITTSEFVYPKKSQLLLAYPKKSHSPFFAAPKNPWVFFSRPKKNPGVFHIPQKITFGQNFRPKKSLGHPRH